MSGSTAPILGWTERFVVADSPHGFLAERRTRDRLLAWSSGPYPTRIEAERALVLERTRALVSGDDEGDGSSGVEIPRESPGVFSVSMEDLRLTLNDGRVLPILTALGPHGPTTDPETTLLVMAGPVDGGLWVVSERGPEWGVPLAS